MASAVLEKNKLSRRKKARAKKTLHKALFRVMSEIERDQFLRSHLFLSRLDKCRLVIGGYIIVKKDNNTYNVYKKTIDNLLYEDLYSFDAAMAIVESLNACHKKRIKDILDAENHYVKNYNDMMIYKHHYEESIKNHTGNSGIFEDRYAISIEKAHQALNKIKRFRIAGK